MRRYAGLIERELTIPGGRDKIFVLDATAAPLPASGHEFEL